MKIHPVRVGVIGYGYWGPNLVRNFFAHNHSTVTMVADLSEDNRRRVTKSYPVIHTTQHSDYLINSPEVDAVAIATPAATHFALASTAIRAGKHVLIEKPIAKSSAEAAELIALARKHGVTLMVDHTFVYTGAVRKMRELIERGELGELYYFDSARINLGLLQQDVNVLWDLATHDLSILLYLVSERPTAVQAIGHKHIGRTQHEIASINLQYAGGFHAHIRVSWLSPVKLRQALIGGSRKMIVYDDVEPTDKIRVYDKGVAVSFSLNPDDVTTGKPMYRAGDVLLPTFDRTEALEVETLHFLECIHTGVEPISGGAAGLDVVRILEVADRSLASGGEFMPLSP